MNDYVQTIRGMTIDSFHKRFLSHMADKRAQIIRDQPNTILASLEKPIIVKLDSSIPGAKYYKLWAHPVENSWDDDIPNSEVVVGALEVFDHRPNILKIFVGAYNPEGWFEDLKLWIDNLAQANTPGAFDQPNILKEETLIPGTKDKLDVTGELPVEPMPELKTLSLNTAGNLQDIKVTSQLQRKREKPPKLLYRVLFKLIIWTYNNSSSWQNAYDNVFANYVNNEPFSFKTFENNRGWAVRDEEIAAMDVTIDELWDMHLKKELEDFLVKIGGKTEGKQRGFFR